MRRALFAFLLLAAPVAASADTEGPYTYTVTNGTATITRFSPAYLGDLSITNALGNHPVTSIGPDAFFNCAGIASVAMPDTLLSIQDGAFGLCSGLTNVVIGANVVSIGSAAFGFCEQLATAVFPNGLLAIGSGAFHWCGSLTRVSIPASVQTIGVAPFLGDTNLAAIDVDLASTSFASVDGALLNHSRTMLIQCPGSQSGAYTVPSGVTAISTGALADCRYVTSILLPPTLTSIGGSAFQSCTGLTEVAIPHGVPEIASHTFFACDSLTSVSIPSTVSTIGFRAFAGCRRLSHVTVPSGTHSIDTEAFADCDDLAGVFFAGDAPAAAESAFAGTTPATLYYLSAYASSWPSIYAGRPTLCWNPIVGTVTAPSTTPFSCLIAGTPDIPVAVEATTNLLAGGWERLLITNIPPDSAFTFNDPDAAAHPARFYRVVAP